MTMGSISFQSNISLILLMIIGILAGIYFYLDIRKITELISKGNTGTSPRLE